MSVDKKQEDIDISGLSSVLPSITSGLNAEDRAGLVNALKNKLQSLAGPRTDVTETLSPRVKKRVEVLRDVQGQHDEFEAKFQEERASLEAKYQKLYEPLYTRRYEIVNGLVEVGVVDESAESNDSESEGKGVPDFWLTAMKTNDVLSEQIQERDEDVLKYLRDIKSLKLVDAKGFKLEFFFSPNSYFKNSVLSKTYHMIDDDDPILEKAVGTEIEWFPGKCLTQKILRKKPKKGSKSTKLITKTEICESFFNFFSPPRLPDDDEELDEDSAEQLQDQMEQDYDVGTAIRDKLIPHAVSWFTGEAAEEEEDAGDEENDEGDDEDDDDDDDDDDEEDEEDDEEEVKPTKKQQSAVHKKAAGEADRPPECKQQ